MTTTDYGPKLKLARLYEKTSKTGNQYFAGRIGMAKVALLKSRDVAEDGGAIWELILSEGGDKQRQGNSATAGTDHQAPSEMRAGAPAATKLSPARDGMPPDEVPF